MIIDRYPQSDNNRGSHTLWGKRLNFLTNFNGVVKFTMRQIYNNGDVEFDPNFGIKRNLTLWVDENGLNLAMAKIEVKKRLDPYTDYDVIDSFTTCVESTNEDVHGQLQIMIFNHQYLQFGVFNYYWQFLIAEYSLVPPFEDITYSV